MKYINYPSNSGHTKRMSLIVPQTRERKKKKKKYINWSRKILIKLHINLEELTQ